METKKEHFTYRLPVKIIAFLLTVVFALLALGCAIGVGVGLVDDWYTYQPKDFSSSAFTRSRVASSLNPIAWSARYGEILMADDGYVNLLYVVYDENGKAIVQNCNGEPANYIGEYDFWWSDNNGKEYAWTVKYWLRNPLIPGDSFYDGKQLYDWAYARRVELAVLAAAFFLLSVAGLAVSLSGAGRKAGREEACPAWINRKIPFDLYVFAAFWVGFGLCALAFTVMESFFYRLGLGPWLPAVILLSLIAAAFITLVVHVLVCFASRVKAGKWWRNTLIYLICHGCWKLLKKLWGTLRQAARGIPLVWKGTLAVIAVLLVNIILSISALSSGMALLLLLAFDGVLLAFSVLGMLQMRRLQRGGEALARGELEYKIDTNGMYWDFKRHGENLNSISEGMTRAVNERMKSEHFKTELITNVSHDIKTPLTSIINYVDLLKKNQVSGDKAEEYLEVLERQSARLKKLTEDLVEASKASSGAIHVELSSTDVCELLRQAVGEYESRFDAAQITPVINTPEKPVNIMCDGRLLWRVFDNLLGNICKYSQAGTRAYMSVDEDGERIWVMVKNISRDILNVSAEELMERFVRGDRSRSTEGSGLGLNIARSLVELQGGTFRLFVDGDLFKVILTFARAPEGTGTPAN